MLLQNELSPPGNVLPSSWPQVRTPMLPPQADRQISLAALVSSISVGIRSVAFVRNICLRSLQVEATLGSSLPGERPGRVRVVVTLDADAPRPTVESLLSHVAKWAPDPILADFAGRLEIALR